MNSFPTELTLGQIEELGLAYSNISVKGMANLTVAKNLVKLRPFIETLQSARDKLIRQHSSGQESLNQNHPNWGAFINDYKQVLKEKVTIDALLAIKEKDLIIKEDDKELQNYLYILMVRKLIE